MVVIFLSANHLPCKGLVDFIANKENAALRNQSNDVCGLFIVLSYCAVLYTYKYKK